MVIQRSVKPSWTEPGLQADWCNSSLLKALYGFPLPRPRERPFTGWRIAAQCLPCHGGREWYCEGFSRRHSGEGWNPGLSFERVEGHSWTPACAGVTALCWGLLVPKHSLPDTSRMAPSLRGRASKATSFAPARERPLARRRGRNSKPEHTAWHSFPPWQGKHCASNAPARERPAARRRGRKTTKRAEQQTKVSRILLQPFTSTQSPGSTPSSARPWGRIQRRRGGRVGGGRRCSLPR